jgi:small subunit ribosomal protein S16
MVTIRLSRGGAKKRPFYQVVVADGRVKRDGGYIERIGFFNPVAVGGEVRLRIDRARAKDWIARGAQPTERVLQLLKEAAKHAEQIPAPAAAQSVAAEAPAAS